MDNKDSELYHQENRQKLIDLQKDVDSLHTRLDGVIKVAVDNPVEEVKVTGEIQVNTEKEVVISNLKDFSDEVEKLGGQITKAIADSRPDKIESVKVSNMADAKTDEVRIKNFDDWAKEIAKLVDAVERIEPVFNIERQQIEWPTDAKHPIAVRLSDGEAFYRAVATAFSGGMAQAGLATEDKQDEIIEALDPPVASAKYIRRFSEVGDDTYIGYAVVTGAAISTAQPVWQIKKISSGGIFLAEGEAAFDKVWDDLADYDYQDA